MGFTSGLKHAGSDTSHEIEIRVNGHTYKSNLPDLPGDDYLSNKGDLWKMSLGTNFRITKCVTPDMVEYIAIEENGNDGWNIDSIVTFFVFDKYYSMLATVDLDVYRWIDGDGNIAHKRFELTRVF